MLYILDRVGTESEGGYGGEEPEIRISVEEAENDTVRPDKPVMALEQLKPYYRGVYFATVSMNKKLVDEGLQGESIAKRVNGYQALVSEYNEAIQETIEANAAEGRAIAAGYHGRQGTCVSEKPSLLGSPLARKVILSGCATQLRARRSQRVCCLAFGAYARLAPTPT